MAAQVPGSICYKLDTVMADFATKMAASEGTILEICSLSPKKSVLDLLLLFFFLMHNIAWVFSSC